MANSDAEDIKTKACWTAADEATLVEEFKSQKSKGHMADSGWKPIAYQADIEALKGSEKVSGGTPKIVPVVKSRWQCVSISCIGSLHS
jgi:hypothetical protein